MNVKIGRLEISKANAVMVMAALSAIMLAFIFRAPGWFLLVALIIAIVALFFCLDRGEITWTTPAAPAGGGGPAPVGPCPPPAAPAAAPAAAKKKTKKKSKPIRPIKPKKNVAALLGWTLAIVLALVVAYLVCVIHLSRTPTIGVHEDTGTQVYLFLRDVVVKWLSSL